MRHRIPACSSTHPPPGDAGVDAGITYDGRKELRSRAASGHEGSPCHVLAEMETLRGKQKSDARWRHQQNLPLQRSSVGLKMVLEAQDASLEDLFQLLNKALLQILLVFYQ